MIRTAHVVCVMMVLLFLMGSSTCKADVAQPADTLKGLKFFAVNIGVSDEKSLARMGLTTADIRAAVELRLRKNGIPIIRDIKNVPKGDLMEVATVSVAVDITGDEASSALTFAINVDVLQLASLARDHHLLVFSSTWHDGAYGILRKGDGKSITETFERSLDKLSADYLSVNGK